MRAVEDHICRSLPGTTSTAPLQSKNYARLFALHGNRLRWSVEVSMYDVYVTNWSICPSLLGSLNSVSHNAYLQIKFNSSGPSLVPKRSTSAPSSSVTMTLLEPELSPTCLLKERFGCNRFLACKLRGQVQRSSSLIVCFFSILMWIVRGHIHKYLTFSTKRNPNLN